MWRSGNDWPLYPYHRTSTLAILRNLSTPAIGGSQLILGVERINKLPSTLTQPGIFKVSCRINEEPFYKVTYVRSKTSTSKKLEIFDVSLHPKHPPLFPANEHRFFTFQNPKKKDRGRNPFPTIFKAADAAKNTHSPRLLGLGKLGSIFFVWKAAKPRRSQDFFHPEDGGGDWWFFLWFWWDGNNEFSIKKRYFVKMCGKCPLRVGSRWSKALM